MYVVIFRVCSDFEVCNKTKYSQIVVNSFIFFLSWSYTIVLFLGPRCSWHNAVAAIAVGTIATFTKGIKAEERSLKHTSKSHYSCHIGKLSKSTKILLHLVFKKTLQL